MTLDGAVRALVGGRNYDESQFNRAIDARRQPGSAFKPFVYLAALENGHRPSDEVFDGPVSIGNWQPANYEGSYEGTITLAHALARSSNSASVQLTNEVGAQTVARIAHRLGVAGELQAVPSLALGTSELSPLDLTTGYAAFANGGDGVIPHVIVRIRTEFGQGAVRAQGLGPRPRDRATARSRHGGDDDGHGDVGNRPRRLARRAPRRGKDRHVAGLSRCVVRRVHVQPDHRRVDRQRFGHADETRDRRRAAGAHLQGLHAEGGTGPSRRAAHWRRHGATAPGTRPRLSSGGRARGRTAAGACARAHPRAEGRSCDFCGPAEAPPAVPAPRARKSCPAGRSSSSLADVRSFRARRPPKRNRNAATPN